MINLHVIILVGRERLHIRRCVEKLAPLQPKCVYLVTSQPDDGTLAIARETAAANGLALEVLHHDWPGTQSVQFNWALEEVEKVSGGDEWILRLDADEYLTEELTEEIRGKLDAGALGDGGRVNGYVLKRRHVVGWLGGKWVRYGMYPTEMVRLFRAGKGRSNLREMDEHIVVNGAVGTMEHDFVDHSLISFDEWREKHRQYAQREARQWMAGEWGNKAGYYRLPPYLRVVLYWFYRFVLRGAIFEGPAAWKWCWYHALWYRWKCDRAIASLKVSKTATTAAVGVDLRRYRNWHGFKNQLVRLVWTLTWTLLARWTPRFVLNRYRAGILRLFGARLGTKCRLTASMEVWIPSRLFVGSHVWIDRNVNLYDVDRITIGDNAIISDGAYICTATHDVTSRTFALVTAPVTIKSSAWIAAKAIVLPGVTIGEGAVVGASAVVTKDVAPWTIVAGNPARVIGKRELRRVE